MTPDGGAAPGALRLRDVAVVRDGRLVLDAVDWDVGSDERWAVIGPNGSGKTTLLRVAGMRLLPTRGTVEVLGERYGSTDARALRHGVAFVSQTLLRSLRPTLSTHDAVLTGRYAASRAVVAPLRTLRPRARLPAARRRRAGRRLAPGVRRALRRRAPAGPAGEGPDGRARTAPARRAGGRTRSRCSRAPGDCTSPRWPPIPGPLHSVAGHAPHRGDPTRDHARRIAARGRMVRAGPVGEVLTSAGVWPASTWPSASSAPGADGPLAPRRREPGGAGSGTAPSTSGFERICTGGRGPLARTGPQSAPGSRARAARRRSPTIHHSKRAAQ